MGGGVLGSQVLEGVSLERGGWSFSGEGVAILNYLKYEIFNEKNSLKTKRFFSVTFKRWDGVKDENF